jgi:hypothetical protein
MIVPFHSPVNMAFFSVHFTPLHAGNQIGAAGAAAVARALEPRRNGDGSWTPSTALTEMYLNGEWVLIVMIVTEEE